MDIKTSQLFEMNEEAIVVFEPVNESRISSIVFREPNPQAISSIEFQEPTDAVDLN